MRVNNWPAAVVMVSAILGSAGVVAVLGWRDPASIATLSGLITTVVGTLLPQAFSRKSEAEEGRK